MTVQGNLRDLSLTSLISVTCNDRSQARMRIVHQEREALLFFAEGDVVHAALGEQEGEEVVYELLTWDEGQFELESDVAAPRHSITTSWSALLLEGLNRIDQQSESEAELAPTVEEPVQSRNLASQLRNIEGVAGAVVVARDGIVLAHDIDGDPDKEGAVAVFVGSAASQIGQALELGALESGVIELGAARARMLVVEQPDYYVGIQVEERASPSLVLQQVRSSLG